MTFDQLYAVMPAAGLARVLDVWPVLDAAMTEFHIVEPLPVRYFLATLAVESGELRYARELASGDAYEGREDLGNTEPGDGRRFKGWSWMQVTGRKNTLLVSLQLYKDERLVRQPNLIDPPDDELNARASCCFWCNVAGLNLSKRALDHGLTPGLNLNDVAAQNDALGVRLAVNGGTNGWTAFQGYVAQAVAVIPTEPGLA